MFGLKVLICVECTNWILIDTWSPGKIKSANICLFGNPAATAASGGTGFIISSGICLNGKYGVVEAVENGGIKTLGAIDLKVTNYYVFKKYELIVAGE